MKVIPLSEAKAHLSEYGRLCHREPVIVTVHGQPAFQLVPLEEDDLSTASWSTIRASSNC
jgi:prevent-host-death family protein